jgi:hypothetical protein
MNNILYNAGLFSLDVSVNYEYFNSHVGRDSSVGTATHYELDGPEIESRWERDFRIRPDRPWGPPSLLYNG